MQCGRCYKQYIQSRGFVIFIVGVQLNRSNVLCLCVCVCLYVYATIIWNRSYGNNIKIFEIAYEMSSGAYIICSFALFYRLFSHCVSGTVCMFVSIVIKETALLTLITPNAVVWRGGWFIYIYKYININIYTCNRK